MTESRKAVATKALPKINSLTGLKVLAMLAIFWLHSPIINPTIDLGAQACLFLFVVSGFLVGYNSLKVKNPSEPTWKDSISYFLKKFKQVWLLHALCAVVMLFLFTVPIFSGTTFIRFVLNLLLLQAWQPDSTNYFSFNGATWFLSALLFCYFMAPLLCKTIRRGKKHIIIAIIITVIIRIAAEFTMKHYPNEIFTVSSHVFPPVRACEFYLGILAVPVWKWLKAKFDALAPKKRLLTASVLEVAIIAISVAVLYGFRSSWLVGNYLCIYVPLIIIMACDAGIISKVLGLKIFRLFGAIQFSFYIMHQVIIRIFNKYSVLGDQSRRVRTLGMFVTTVILAILYNYVILPAIIKFTAFISGKLRRNVVK